MARPLEGGATQKTVATYNAQGMATSKTDPLGRQTTYTYAANGIDLLEVRQVNGGATDVLATYAGYNGHQRETFDATINVHVVVRFEPVAFMLESVQEKGVSLWEHERNHANAWLSLCSLQGMPSEGFATKEKCQAGRKNFIDEYNRRVRQIGEQERRRDGK